MSTRRLTFNDVTYQLLDYLGGDVSEPSVRACHRAIRDAQSEFVALRDWAYYYTVGELLFNPEYSTGTISYDHTGGGTCENQVTLTGGTWPSYADKCCLMIAGLVYFVKTRHSNSVIQLDATVNPGSDLTDVSYTLYQDEYLLPENFQKGKDLVSPSFGYVTYVNPANYMIASRMVRSGATPKFYTVMGARKDPFRMSVYIWPFPTSACVIPYQYHRKMRSLTIESYSTGTVAVAEGGTTVTVTTGVFSQNMVGSIIRLSESGNSRTPTGIDGANRAAEELEIYSVATNGATLETRTAAVAALSGVKYIVSDPIDVEDGPMMQAYLRLCEKRLAISKQLDSRMEIIEKHYNDALLLAFENDRKNSAMKSVYEQSVVNPFRMNNTVTEV